MKLKTKCQCDLCDCGRHRCELHVSNVPKYQSVPADPNNFKTSYQEQYKPCKAEKPRVAFLPIKAHKVEKLPFFGVTEASTEFHAKQIPPRFRKEKEKYEKPEGNMDMTTTKSADYTVKSLKKQKSYKPSRGSERPKELPQFEGETTTNSFYKQYKDVVRQPMCSEHPTNLRCNTDKFADQTTTKHSYPRYSAEKRTMPIIPIETQHNTGQQFYSTTTTSENYKGLSGEVPKPATHSLPATYKLPTGEMYTETTTQAHYKPVVGDPRPKPIIPQTIRQPPAQFQGNTTNKDTYPVHAVTKRPQPKEKEKYNPPTEKMDVTSMHREYYKPHSVVQRRVRKLSPIQRKNSAPLPRFEDKTTHRDEFRKWKIEKQRAYGEPPRIMKPPSCKMETRTMQKSDFVYDKNKVERVNAIIPQVKVIRSDQPIDTLTSYKLQFKGLQNKCRLAEILMKQAVEA